MKVSLNWLSDYVTLPAVEELAKKLTMAGLEVEGIEAPGKGLHGVVVAQILESKQHPNADKLSVTQVDAGPVGKLQIVCGAKNYKVGDKVPLATVGASLPNGVNISKAQLRGVESSGMLCSAKELGLAADASGLLILDPKLEVGMPIAKALGLDDTVFELNVTPNRPDALSHLGVAREVAVLTGQKLKRPEPKLSESSKAATSAVTIKIEDAERCPRYAARVIEGVTIGPSPDWMVRRLEAAGVRSINNVVDVTNYVLLECGQPLHAFDLDQVGGSQIVVRRAKAGEKLTTLDGKERALDPDDLLICDKDAPQVIAGVMGGAKSEVTNKTTRILLESAKFQPSTVRRSSKRHALHTESSHRFERGTDVSGVIWALDRAAQLIAELGKGTVLNGRIDQYPKPIEQRKVTLRLARPGQILGVEVPAAESQRILEALGFEADTAGAKPNVHPERSAEGAESKGAITYRVPYARVDVDREEDLVEEIARIRGYESIPLALPRGLAKLAPEPRETVVERKVRSALSGAGFDEVVNYSFISPDVLPWTAVGALDTLGRGRPMITLLNPLSVEQSVMRQSLYPGLLQNLSHNLRHQADSLRLYELGRAYHPDVQGGRSRRPVAHETLWWSGVLHGRRDGRTWGAKDVPMDFHDAKGAVEAVLSALNLEQAKFEAAELAPYHPRATAVVKVGDRVVGSVGELHPKVARKLDLAANTFLWELDAKALEELAVLDPLVKPLTRFPAVYRDVAFLVPVELPHDRIREVIRDVGAPLVEDAHVFDVYTGKPIPEGKKNIAFAVSYRSPDRTLTDAEVQAAHAKIVDEVNRRLGGALRA